ncbi:amino acid adenylation domain-containing protein [Streptomyces cyaneogriseus]|uniref:amino acid adenylation domain-containing protein n=1 Tax=Streptomyces cyaneogriseus TaxID=68192 RepID=UPI0005C82B34|nr:amino acid adenylation domain-containing protein [Streptomyces cyaneogriseus]
MPKLTGWQQQLVHDFAEVLASPGSCGSAASVRGALTRQGWTSACLSVDDGGLGLMWAETALLAEQLGRSWAPSDVIDTVVALPLLTAAAPREATSVQDGTSAIGLVTPAQAHGCTLSRRGQGASDGAQQTVCRFTEVPRFVLLPVAGSPEQVRGVEAAAEDAVRHPTPGGDLWELSTDAVGPAEAFRAPAASLWAATTLLRNAHLLGMALTAVETATDRARTRRQFGRPIGTRQAVSFPLATQRARLEALRMENHAQLLRLDELVLGRSQSAAPAAEFAAIDADAATVTDAVWPLLCECVRHAVHVHGASGLQDDRPVAVGYRRLLAEAVRLGLGAKPHTRTSTAPAGDSDPMRGLGLRRSAHARQLAQRREPAAVRDSDQPLPPGSCVHEMVEQAAARHPEAVALRAGTSEITYREFNLRADQFADALRGRGIGTDDTVGLLMEHGADTVVAILGILKAGASYLPLDPRYPPERIAFMVRDSKAIAVITDQQPSDGSVDLDAPVLTQEQIQSSPGPTHCGHTTEQARPDSLAYLIYTSGSTGTPKGVEVEHRGLANRLRWDAATFPLGPGDAVLHHTSLSFDISVWEIFTPLISGATLVVGAPDLSRDPHRLLQEMRHSGVTVLACVPSLLDVLLEERQPALADISDLRYVFCGGETLSAELCRRFHALELSAELHNFYGPSECTIDVTSWHCRPQEDMLQVPIGRPLTHVSVHVLDEAGAVVPPGYPGELYVGGAGVARGYRNRPDLTVERFVPDPFTSRRQGRLYRTGDLVRMSRDGVLHFIGRSDGQVKVRGHRIELDEIRCTLERHPEVRTAVVRVVSGHIEAHIVPTSAGAPRTDALLRHVRSSLPEYMVPSALAVVASLPMTRNGKIDHAALPPIRTAHPASEDGETAIGGNPDERALITLATRLLGVESLSPTDDFFAAGGTSLQAARFVSRVRAECGLDVRLEQFFAAPTIRDLVKVIHDQPRDEAGAGHG